MFEGEGFAVVGDERKPVGPGDVINIPSNVPHTMENAKDAPFLWAASGGIATRTPLPCAGRRPRPKPPPRSCTISWKDSRPPVGI